MSDVTTSPNLNQNLADPELIDLLHLFERQILLNFNSHHLATIQGFDATKQTATATINYTKTIYTRIPNNAKGVYSPKQVQYPPLQNCPVVVLGGSKAALTFPIAVGDECIVMFNDRDMDNWFQNTQVTPVATGRLHSFSDGVILVGVRSLKNKLTGYDAARAVLRNDKAKVAVGTTKIELSNDTKNLYTILNTLVTKLNTLATDITLLTVTCATPGNPSSPPVNAAAFTALASDFTTLATDLGALLE